MDDKVKSIAPHHFSLKSGAGFTLIETLIYIALFGVILGGIVISSYPLITGADKLSQRVVAESEAQFVLHKIAWAVSYSPVSSITGGSTLSINFTAGSPITFTQAAGVITMNGSALSASRVNFSSFSVTPSTLLAPVVGNAPRQFTVSFTADGEAFSQTYNVYY